jgi:hypothetical protein
MKILAKSLFTSLLLLALCGTSPLAQSAKAEPSPFAGTWCGPLMESAIAPHFRSVSNLVISDGGQISGGWKSGYDHASYSGRVSSDGIIKLTISGTWIIVSFDRTRGSGGSHRVRLDITAVVTLDEQGNLVGIGEAKGCEPSAFVWSRCE